MILDPTDPHRGRCGHHHDRHRSSDAASATAGLVRQCCVKVSEGEDRSLLAQADHIAASLEARLVVADLRPERNRCLSSAPSISGLERSFHSLAPHDREGFLHLARSSDCVIVDNGRLSSAHALATLSGRPFLVVPAGLASERIGMRVLFFWDQRGCTAMALRDVIPFLRDAYAITIVGENAEAPLSYLECHGFSVEVVETDDADDGGVADLLAGNIPARLAASRGDDAALLISPTW